MNRSELESGFNIRLFLAIASVVLIVLYGLFNARNLIFGPSIEIISPVAPQSETSENILIVKGKVRNMAYLSLNQRPIFVDTEGFFEEKLLLSLGSNIIEIRARDRFKKEALQILNVYYKPNEQASSTNEKSDQN